MFILQDYSNSLDYFCDIIWPIDFIDFSISQSFYAFCDQIFWNL